MMNPLPRQQREDLQPLTLLARLEAAYQEARAALLRERTPAGFWVGELSTSALSTAVAVSALALVRKAGQGTEIHDSLITGGLAWLKQNQNADGGWGDTVRSFSNVSTTMLCRAAFRIAGKAEQFRDCLDRADAWVARGHGDTPEKQAESIRARYGKDRTFSVPILMTCALAGMVSWKEVPALPFELACFPQKWFRYLKLQVVSYALPALIAIGQCVYHHKKPWNLVARLARRLAMRRSLRVLERIQPSNGGFLEATPLTSFVTMALAASGRAGHPVARLAVDFIEKSVRPDGSWPIDTNLATWVTTLSINALAEAGELQCLPGRERLRDWLLGQQHRVRHPYTDAAPGAWAWTDLPGGVPDCDDTPGALLALAHLGDAPPPAVKAGLDWVLSLQNADGGWPTFCRGWTDMPFDRSGADLTAHALRALHAWDRLGARLDLARTRGLAYLARVQRADGSWLPLWFGNQHAPDDINPTYGTARVLAAYRDLGIMDSEPARKGVAWLLANQNDDGGWGGCQGTPSSVEETALAVEVLLSARPRPEEAVNRGLTRLVQMVEAGGLEAATPIGFYFAKLWYFEKLYPIIFAVAALGRARLELSPAPPPGPAC